MLTALLLMGLPGAPVIPWNTVALTASQKASVELRAAAPTARLTKDRPLSLRKASMMRSMMGSCASPGEAQITVAAPCTAEAVVALMAAWMSGHCASLANWRRL
jgi:hypothetical protein